MPPNEKAWDSKTPMKKKLILTALTAASLLCAAQQKPKPGIATVAASPAVATQFQLSSRFVPAFCGQGEAGIDGMPIGYTKEVERVISKGDANGYSVAKTLALMADENCAK